MAWNEITVSNLGRTMQRFNSQNSTQRRIPPFFFGTMTMGCTHSVGSTTFSDGWYPCLLTPSVRLRSSATGRDPLSHTGMAPSMSCKWKGVPVIHRNFPSKIKGHFAIRSSRPFFFWSVDGSLTAARWDGEGIKQASRFLKLSGSRWLNGPDCWSAPPLFVPVASWLTLLCGYSDGRIPKARWIALDIIACIKLRRTWIVVSIGREMPSIMTL